VALNYQTEGTSMDLNQALFRLNRATGYVLKPEFMRCADVNFVPTMPRRLPVKGSSGPCHITFTVIGAQGLPDSVPNLYENFVLWQNCVVMCVNCKY
jgi:hypothetical protein